MRTELRILIIASQPAQREALSRLCHEAGFVHLQAYPLQLPLPSEEDADLVLLGLQQEDLSEIPPLLNLLSHVPVVIVCRGELAEQLTERAEHGIPAALLVEPVTAEHLRAVLPLARRRFEYLSRALTESQWLWDVLSSIGDGVIVTDEHGRVHFLNPAAEKITGWTLDEARQRPLSEIFPIFNEETRQPVENPVERVLREGCIVGLGNHTILRRRTGEELAIDDSGAPVRDATGRLRGAVLVFRDVTELRQLHWRNQHALALRQKLLELLHSLLELRSAEDLLSRAVHALSSLLPLELACLYTLENDSLLPRWHAISLPQLEPLVHAPIPLHSSLLGSILLRGSPTLINDAQQDPHSYYPEGFPAGIREHLIGIPLSIGQHRAILALARYAAPPFSEEEMEIALLFARYVQLGLLNAELVESLRRSEAQYRELLEWLPLPLLIHAEGRILYANRAVAHYLNADSPDALRGLSPLEIVAPEDRAAALQRVEALYRGEISVAPPRHTRLLARDGSLREALVTATRVRYENRDAVLVAGIDITEQQRLQRQRERERAALQIIATAALQSRTRQELCQYFLVEACRELGFAGGSVRLVEGELLVPITLAGPFNPELFPAVPLSDERILAAHVARTRQPIYAPDVEQYPFSEPHRQRLREAGMRAVLSYPILGEGGTLLGTFQLFHPEPLSLGEDARHFFDVVAHALGVALDRLRLAEELQHSERRFRLLAENAPVAITRFGLAEGRYLFANREFERQSGYTLEEFEALSDRELIEMIHPDDRQRIFRFWREWERAGFPGVQRIGYRIFNRQGETVWLDTYLYAERQPDGKIESIVQVCVDITPLKRAEEELQRALQEDFRRTVQNLHALVFRLRRQPDGTTVYALREGKLAGQTTTTAVYDRPLHELPEQLRFPEEVLSRAFAGERVTFEAHHGETWLLYTLEPVFSPEGDVLEIVGTALDISSRKLLEQRLQESEQRYRSLLETLPIGVLELVIDSTGRGTELYTNPAFEHITGYTLEELASIPTGEIIYPEDRQWVLSRWSEWLRHTEEPILQLEYRCLRKSGEPYWLQLQALKIPQQDGGWRIVEVGADITLRKEVELQMQHLASFPLLSPLPVIEVDEQGTLLFANPAAENSLPLAELSLQHPFLAGIQDKLPELRTSSSMWVREVHGGDLVWLQHIFWLPEQNRLRIYAVDITLYHLLRHQLEEALERERELAITRSRLMGAIAHEFRTPLAGIQFSVELLQRYFERLSPAERQHELDNIAARVHDLNTLVTDFLTQSSLDILRRSLEQEEVSLQRVCREAIEQVSPLIRSKHQSLELELPEQELRVRGDAKVLRLVLLTLLTNATKYSGPRTTITVRLRRELGTAVLEVEDQGTGIPEEELPHLFQPFFRGSNTQGIPGVGLGLMLAKEFIEAHRGSIFLRSHPGSGTTVTLHLPLLEE